MIDKELVSKALEEVSVSANLLEAALSTAEVSALRVVLLGYNEKDNILMLTTDEDGRVGWIFTLSLDEDGVLLGELTFSADVFLDAYREFRDNGNILPLDEYLSANYGE